MLCPTRKFLTYWIRIGSLTEARSGRTGAKLSERFTLRELERNVKENLQKGHISKQTLDHFETKVRLSSNKCRPCRGFGPRELLPVCGAALRWADEGACPYVDIREGQLQSFFAKIPERRRSLDGALSAELRCSGRARACPPLALLYTFALRLIP